MDSELTKIKKRIAYKKKAIEEEKRDYNDHEYEEFKQGIKDFIKRAESEIKEYEDYIKKVWPDEV